MKFLFKPVTRKNKCNKCLKATWCSVSECGLLTICRRQRDTDAIAKKDKNGIEYYIYINNEVKHEFRK